MGNQTYQDMRYERLVDVMHEYFGCDDKNSGAKAFIVDINKAVNELRQWPQQQLGQLITLHSVMNGKNHVRKATDKPAVSE